MFVCKHCKKEFEDLTTSQKANHSRWCLYNPKRTEYKNLLASARDKVTEESRRKIVQGIKEAHAAGKYSEASKKSIETRRMNGTLCHTPEAKELIRRKALSSKHRRLVRSVRKYVRPDGSIVMLDSSWEEALARQLDKSGVTWVRPETPIQYVGIDGRVHNYFPDFYLPEHNLYLDPKNPAAINAQKDKLEVLLKKMDNLIILKSLEDCLNYTP